MPQIRQYQPDVSPQAPLPGRSPERLFAEPDSFGAGPGSQQLARGLDNAGSALYDVAQTQEVSTVNARWAQARAQWTTALTQRANAPGAADDPNFASDFVEQFADSIAPMGDDLHTAGGKTAFARGKAEMVAHFSQQASGYQIHLAGVKAKQDYVTALDANRNTLTMDPTQFMSVLNDTTAQLNDPSGPYAKMPADQRAALELQTKTALAQSAVQGTIRANPQAALKQLQDGTWAQYLKPENAWALTNQADTAIRGQQIDQMRLEAAARKAQDQAEQATADHFVTQLVKDPTGLSATDVANSNLKPAQKLEWLGIIQRSAARDDKITTDSGLFVSLFDDIHAGKISNPDDLNQYVGHGLDIPHLQTLRGEIAGRKTPGGEIEATLKNGLVTIAKSALTGSDPLMHFRDPQGDTQLQKFMSWFLPQYEQQRQAGKSAVQLLSPDSPDYLGKGIQQFTRNRAQMMKDIVDANPEAFGDGGPAKPAAPTIDVSKATRTGTMKDGTKAYEINGAWVDGSGKAIGATAPKPPALGEVRDGYKFKGGDPSKADSWEPAAGQPPAAPLDLTTAEGIRAAYAAGKLSYDDAAKTLREKGFAQ